MTVRGRITRGSAPAGSGRSLYCIPPLLQSVRAGSHPARTAGAAMGGESCPHADAQSEGGWVRALATGPQGVGSGRSRTRRSFSLWATRGGAVPVGCEGFCHTRTRQELHFNLDAPGCPTHPLHLVGLRRARSASLARSNPRSVRTWSGGKQSLDFFIRGSRAFGRAFHRGLAGGKIPHREVWRKLQSVSRQSEAISLIARFCQSLSVARGSL
jgi:hypothetical protein